LVLAVDEKFVSKTFQRQLADQNNELTLDDAVKIVGCWNGLSKHASQVSGLEALGTDIAPMHRAVAFSRSIKDSKKIVSLFSQIVEQYRHSITEDDSMLDCEVRHVDGTFNVLLRNNLLDWLKADTSEQGNVCRILSNARCLSEGVDVPALDAVMFLNPRDSVVDVVQSVGRVMRKVEGKQYGYIILPVGIPADTTPEAALADNKRYKVVWQVLQALRAHDDRFNAMINKLDLNNKPTDNLQIIGVGGGGDTNGDAATVKAQMNLSFPQIEEWREAIYAKIVLKCGDRRYWETWAADVAVIAQRHIQRITALLSQGNTKPRRAFNAFLAGLHENLNPSISELDAIEMLAQHLITKPVFDALFEGYQFTKQNPVSLSMQKILDILEGQALEKETASLDKFYASVRDRASGIDNAAGKQKIIVELYDKFFRIAFKSMVERLGIVYTPVEVVDFIIHSVNDALSQEFGVSLSDKGVHVLDPFTGTGTFMVRLLQSGLIKPKDMLFKYQNELHANELVLLAYYIAAINIEETFHDLTGGEYRGFEGIVLTDTFQLQESAGMNQDLILQENNERANKQRKNKDIRVILGNPPYSVGQESANDANKNLKYPRLDEQIRTSYAAQSTATNKNSLYNSYIRAFRWASDRIGEKGVVCFVSGSFLDTNSGDGLRKCLPNDFTSIYCFNLRGDQRTSGELSRSEGGKIFGSGSRSPITISLLVKNPEKTGPCELHYYDIGEYLSREEKLKIISEYRTYLGISWSDIYPNAEGDWINHRSADFGTFVPLNEEPQAVFAIRSNGVQTNRDAWVYNTSKTSLATNMQRMIAFYNEQVNEHGGRCNEAGKTGPELAGRLINKDPRKIKWTRGLIDSLCRQDHGVFNADNIRIGLYRPFCKSWVYYDRQFNEYFKEKYYPSAISENLAIQLTGTGSNKGFSCLMVDTLPDLEVISKGQCFPLHYYEKVKSAPKQGQMFEDEEKSGFTKRDGITDISLSSFRKHYKFDKLSKEDIFYYCYGVLHLPAFTNRYAADLRKMLPRVPLVKDFWAFSNAGRELARWHLDYEAVEPYPLTEAGAAVRLSNKERYRVLKMTFGKKDGKPDKSVIVYNAQFTLSDIPLKAYEYVVNGKPALEWVMERYQLTTDKETGISNDPNEWSKDPKYIFDLVKRIVRVSLETMKIVDGLSALEKAI
jgi:predicted helicase